jgi:hypothetical protein
MLGPRVPLRNTRRSAAFYHPAVANVSTVEPMLTLYGVAVTAENARQLGLR